MLDSQWLTPSPSSTALDTTLGPSHPLYNRHLFNLVIYFDAASLDVGESKVLGQFVRLCYEEEFVKVCLGGLMGIYMRLLRR